MPGAAAIYGYVTGDLRGFTMTGAVLVAIVAIEAARRAITRTGSRRLAPHDVVACLACLALPAIGTWLGHATGALTDRYLVCTTVGLAFAVPQLLWWITPENAIAELIAALALILALSGLTIRTITNRPGWDNPLQLHPVLSRELERPGPVAMTGGVAFLGVWYNLPATARSRAVYLADADAERERTGSDTIDRGYLTLARWTWVPVARVDEFAAMHPHFALYSFGSGWAEARLRSMGASLTERARAPFGDAVLYDVSMPVR
jgi:hypothetical protein